MYIFLTVLIILVCVLMIIAVLVQNPKGGGLSATFGGMGNQVMGARRATDFIEKTTWTLVIALLVLSLASGLFMPAIGDGTELPKSDIEDRVNDNLPFIPDNNEELPFMEDESAE